jgi:phage gp29-like protein
MNSDAIDKSELEKSQLDETAQTQYLKSEFAGHLGKGLTPARLNQILQRAEQGWIVDQCDLFEDMEERDGHICAELSKRKHAISGLPYEIKAPKNATAQENKLTETIAEIFEELPDFEDVILNLSEAIGFGFANLEIEWDFAGGIWQPHNLIHRPARWFQLSMTDRNQIRLRDGSSDGAELWQAGWLVHKHKAKSGDVSRMGLHRALAFPYLFKQYAVNDLAEFLEIYGLPMRLGTYPNGASDVEKKKLAQAVALIGHSAAGIIPDGQKIEFVEAAKGTGEPFKTLIDWCESTQSKVILGGTLTSQADGKSSTNALGNVHNEVRHDLLKSDAMQIASSLNRFIKLICQVNGWQGRTPKFVFDTQEPEDIALFADAIPKLVAVGMNKIPASFLYEKLKIPMAKDGEEVLSAAQSTSPLPPFKGGKATALSSLAPFEGGGAIARGVCLNADNRKPVFTPEQQVIENIADDLLDNVTAPLSNEQLQQVIRAAKSPEDLENRLAILMAKADFSQFSDTLSKALFAADVLGYTHA